MGLRIDEILVGCLIKINDVGLGLTKNENFNVIEAYFVKTQQTGLFPEERSSNRWFKYIFSHWSRQLSPRMATCRYVEFAD